MNQDQITAKLSQINSKGLQALMRGLVAAMSWVIVSGKAKFKKSHALKYPSEALLV